MSHIPGSSTTCMKASMTCMWAMCTYSTQPLAQTIDRLASVFAVSWTWRKRVVSLYLKQQCTWEVMYFWETRLQSLVYMQEYAPGSAWAPYCWQCHTPWSIMTFGVFVPNRALHNILSAVRTSLLLAPLSLQIYLVIRIAHSRKEKSKQSLRTMMA